ncbi:carboxypeptidase N subunit 2-like isoform X1 [Neodiprion fabricii]|uniref:carboxypeptidase N subunit 2-like isoform X1 n=1 Tax=Neodiprion fabricii TaxID=2872261 RepID=UPI001ED934CB|nr:carboxypeptidase N subunit 2-like isoform X1 [Neodiprion fabricii]XP_046426226.1 carboxypeptidase N subunit 2-like isoform X1 [Neodiprion fabricii]XP_046426228.1 carboxypeptidase N subunit 2-like isoform X1 [Neodiprion fabricii]XP_046426229.1 carboxypeptidase N subunit 2-like isoform X1 [Neodiprion fabricii]XP_046426230.1 carboxypeptidase N subunit 2-like isoform X1 [Neodiprion fabricii]
MTLKILLLLAALVGSAVSFNGELEEQECPVDCHCHYFRINWVTDCSESNLTTIPYNELSPNVYILDMNGNNIAEISPFPQGIKMRRLQMAHNRLTRLTRESFAGLAYLLDADFSYNMITTIDPDTFGDSPGLITLELQNNPLSHIDGHFLKSRSLLYLDINSCGIHSLSTEFFYNTTALNKLDLSNNPLERIDPEPFNHLTNLEYLQLNNCNLSFVSPEAFVHLENLRELEMRNNKLGTLSWKSVLHPMTRLERLDIRNSSIVTLPGDAFSENLYLRQLNLAENELRHLDVGSTLGHNLQNLQSLDLSNCNLKDRLTEEAFRNASKLRVLHLDGNPLFASDLTAVLGHLPKLQKLSLSNCGLNKLPEAFHVLQDLQELKISHNPLNNAFVSLLNPLESLEYLDMSYSNLGYVGNETFSKMTMLKRLILSGNKLHTLEQGLFTNLTRLESLELNYCDLKTPINPNVFGDHPYTSIVELKLSGNPLVVPESEPLLPRQLSRLETLDLSNCNITNFSIDSFINSRNLTRLNLSGNRLSSKESLEFLKKLHLLEWLDLSSNNFTSIRPHVFRLNPRLRHLNLIGNPFKCDCDVVEMWTWANRVKNDLHILAGSQPAEFSAGSAKFKKTLTCAYDEDIFRSMVDQNREATADRRNFMRKSDFTPHRTWAKYVKESSCAKS